MDGMGCGADATDDLAAGAFNEADSHRSFLDALNEWRSGSKAVAAASTAGGGDASSRECQTETSSGATVRQAPAAPKKSFFHKLAMNSASREAGQSATG